MLKSVQGRLCPSVNRRKDYYEGKADVMEDKSRRLI